jgi:RimJ/RimL family protein N-acetyltransferase
MPGTGTPIDNWQHRNPPSPERLVGNHVLLTAYQPTDAVNLWKCFGGTQFNELTYYFPIPILDSVEQFAEFWDAQQETMHTMVFRDPDTNEVQGMASYMHIDANNGVCEVGAVCHSPKIMRSTATTEAHYLMAKHVFDALGYRRYEWKLNNDNMPSHAAAKRFGFTFEGIFRNHMVAKGMNRDTAWYSMIDSEWPQIKAGFEAWLAPSNFDEHGVQVQKLQQLRF